MKEEQVKKELSITPQTRVGALLDAYPELEETLIDMAPAFARLKNPVLRRTVAKVATLEAAAGLAGLEPREMVAALRRAAGQPVEEEEGGSPAREDAGGPVPEWVDEERVRATVDAAEIISRGEVPLPVVLEAARGLSGGEILRVTVSFEPVPLIETLQKQGYRTFVRKDRPEEVELFVARYD